MTRKHRSFSSESPSYSAAIGKTHRRITPTQKVLPQEEDYNDESSQENEYEQSEEDDDVDDSESMSNAPPKDPSFSQKRNTYIPETPSFSASDFPNSSSQPNINASSSYLRSVRGKKGIGMVPTCGFCEGSHEEYGCKVKEGMREVWRQSKRKEWNDEVAKDFLRLVSLGETDEGEKGVQSVKKSQCQCSKHQCSKNKLLRNTSIQSRNSHRH
ncbi:hypothetical protein VNO77_37070 [Canavalia gladiata]|uniref:Uncharacterized protein n=1 Tax=Canavalia gladiata TaxID=3824 RepID=A0AAN9K8K3_CANGL